MKPSKINPAPLRVELLKQWLEKNKEYLSQALFTDKAELIISMKGASFKAKVTQFPDEI